MAATGGPTLPLWHWARFASPLAILLAVLAGCAWLIHRPLAQNRKVRSEAVRATWRGRAGDAEALARLHPEIRPWVRYAESQRACDTAACFHRQIVSRLEGLSIGPTFSGEDATLRRFLILNGWYSLALKLFERNDLADVEIWVRLDRPRKARLILDRVHRRTVAGARDEEILLLIEEGRLEEAYSAKTISQDFEGQRSTVLKAVLAHLTGRCIEAERLALSLLSPQALAQIRLPRESSPIGQGSLMKAAREIRIHASYAAGLALLDQTVSAEGEWNEAERLAEVAGMPGLLDVDRVLLRRVAQEGPWSAPPPPHHVPDRDPPNTGFTEP